MYYLIIYLFPSGWSPPPWEGLGEVSPATVNAIPTSGNAIPSSGNGLRRYGRSHASPVDFIDIAVELYRQSDIQYTHPMCNTRLPGSHSVHTTDAQADAQHTSFAPIYLPFHLIKHPFFAVCCHCCHLAVTHFIDLNNWHSTSMTAVTAVTAVFQHFYFFCTNNHESYKRGHTGVNCTSPMVVISASGMSSGLSHIARRHEGRWV